MGKTYKKYERRIYSVLDLFGEIGGLGEVFYALGFIFVACIASVQFDAAMLQKVY